MKINCWLRLERRVQQELRYASSRTSTADVENLYDLARTLKTISDIFGEELGRGYTLTDEWLDEFTKQLPLEVAGILDEPVRVPLTVEQAEVQMAAWKRKR